MTTKTRLTLDDFLALPGIEYYEDGDEWRRPGTIKG